MSGAVHRGVPIPRVHGRNDPRDRVRREDGGQRATLLKVAKVASFVLAGIVVAHLHLSSNPPTPPERLLPGDLSSYMTPGMVVPHPWTMGCLIDDVLPIGECEERIRKFSPVLAHPEIQKQLRDNCPQATKNGCPFTPDLPVLAINIDPTSVQNYEAALHYIDENFLRSKHPSPETLRGWITESSAKILGKGAAQKYRAEDVFISGDRVVPNVAGFQAALTEQHATKQEISTFTKIWKTMQQKGLHAVLKTLTPSEKEIVNKAVTIPLEGIQVEAAMHAFADDLSLKISLMEKGEIDPILLAAETHQTLVRIHPFTDGTGRLARAWMNAILYKGNLPVVRFANEAAYTKAAKEIDNPRVFEGLLRQMTKKSG